MRPWIFPIVIFVLIAATLSLIYFNPQFFSSPKLISPLAPDSVTVFITPSPNPSSVPSPLKSSPVPTGPVSSITLTTQKISTASARLLWTVDGQTQTGFVILQSTASAPVFPTRPGDQARSTYAPTTREFTLNNLTGRVYLRVCELLQNSCGTYSNQITLDF